MVARLPWWKPNETVCELFDVWRMYWLMYGGVIASLFIFPPNYSFMYSTGFLLVVFSLIYGFHAAITRLIPRWNIESLLWILPPIIIILGCSWGFVMLFPEQRKAIQPILFVGLCAFANVLLLAMSRNRRYAIA
ncbi:MAG: hypothetical protein COB69_03910 [Phycisphaera sp.]|nr:MAG: hypothetical protein COB69_03910 [Phycisphaera sp.]